MSILSLLKPQNIFTNKVRLGPKEDGGYVMPEIVLQNCSALLTYGVGNDIRYEEEFSNTYKKPVYLFDHTLGNPGWKKDDLTFFPTGLGFGENCKEWYQDYEDLNINGDIFLKIDVEGYEYEYFTKTDILKLRDKVVGLILEIHWIDNEKNRNDCVEILQKLKVDFLLCHVHGNNWGDLWEFEGHSVPKVLELSFINKKYVEKYESDTQDYPILGLDIPNCPHREDYKLDFLKYY